MLKIPIISHLLKARSSPPPTLANVAYGNECSRQKLDYWASPKNQEAPQPALVFFHGGGFVCGSKFYCRQMREVQERGAVAIAVNYRFVRKHQNTVAQSMEDGMNALNFIRDHAKQWNIDPDRIALHGKSSGGSIALWLGMKTPIRGITTHNTPTCFDPDSLVQIGQRRIEAFWPIWTTMASIYRAKELSSQRVQQLIDLYSPIKQVRENSPPLFLYYTTDPPAKRGGLLQTLHNVHYGELMEKRYAELQLPCTLNSPAQPSDQSALEFLCDVLNLPPKPEV